MTICNDSRKTVFTLCSTDGQLLYKGQIPLSYPVADRSEAGRRPVADLLAPTSSLPVIGQVPARCRSATSLGPVCDQDSVMAFGFNCRPTRIADEKNL